MVTGFPTLPSRRTDAICNSSALPSLSSWSLVHCVIGVRHKWPPASLPLLDRGRLASLLHRDCDFPRGGGGRWQTQVPRPPLEHSAHVAHAVPRLAHNRHRVRLAMENDELDLPPELEQTHIHLLSLLERGPKVTGRGDDPEWCRHPVHIGHRGQPAKQLRIVPGLSVEREVTEVPANIARSVEGLQVGDRPH